MLAAHARAFQAGVVRETGPTAISKQPKPPAVTLETQAPLSHKPATGTSVKEPAVKNLNTWTKDLGPIIQANSF